MVGKDFSPRGNSTKGHNISNFDRPDSNGASEFSSYERSVANLFGYFAVSRTRFSKDPLGNYKLNPTFPLAQFIYWVYYLNALIKAVFLFFLIIDYFGPVVFLDKIAALDYILCVGIILLGNSVWVNRYPMHELLHAIWTVENRIFQSLSCPQNVKRKVQQQQSATVWILLVVVWVGCSCLVIQVLADPKYCTFTYSSFQYESWWLGIVFGIHEFFFMMLSWNNQIFTTGLCTFEAISLSNLLPKMTASVRSLYQFKVPSSSEKKFHKKSQADDQALDREVITVKERDNQTKTYRYDSIEKLIFDYKQLILVTDLFNEFVPYKFLILHICTYCQLISDVFVAIQVLKMEGTGFMDVWFYLEDCIAGVYLILRVYTYMSRVASESEAFLRAFHEYRLYGCSRKELYLYRKISRTLKTVGLKLGPFIVTPMTVLSALDTFGNYYVCAALW